MTHEEYKKKLTYLDDNIFCDLENLNNGFDSLSISYFSPEDFMVVMERCKEKQIGIYGIESWLKDDKVYYSVKNFEDWKTYPHDSKWYYDAFNQLLASGKDLMFSASYYIPSLDY